MQRTRPRTVLIVYNTSLYVVRFRLRLIAELQAHGYQVIVVSPVDPATPELERLGIRHIPLRMSQYGMNPFAEIGTMLAIKAEMKRLCPFASLHYTIKPNIFGTLAAARAGVPVINNVAGAGWAFTSGHPLLRFIVSALYRRALRHSSTVFFQNRENLRTYVEGGLVAPAKARRLPGSGVDLDRFTPVPMPAEQIRFLFVGRLLKEKGIREFLLAARTARAVDPSLAFEIVGEIEDSPHYIRREELGQLTGDGIEYRGAVPSAEIPRVLAGASCVVLPSCYGEGVPRSLLEACATGRPVITTDNPGCRDVVDHGVNGFMVPVRDPEALADAMLAFSRLSPSEREGFSLAARTRVENEFDERIVIRAYLDALEMIARERGEVAMKPEPAFPSDACARSTR